MWYPSPHLPCRPEWCTLSACPSGPCSSCCSRHQKGPPASPSSHLLPWGGLPRRAPWAPRRHSWRALPYHLWSPEIFPTLPGIAWRKRNEQAQIGAVKPTFLVLPLFFSCPRAGNSVPQQWDLTSWCFQILGDGTCDSGHPCLPQNPPGLWWHIVSEPGGHPSYHIFPRAERHRKTKTVQRSLRLGLAAKTKGTCVTQTSLPRLSLWYWELNPRPYLY